ncbi:MAG: sigma-70 family RNA polymerase sigma factor [Verrucomicrobia bacterium]|nr:sigma-70 family RNA polymerase sigma factor [Verrucomicrobiota bacterium]
MSDPTPHAQDVLDMQRLAGGHDAALNALMERHGQRLFHYLLRQVQSEAEANDLAQETFVKVYLNCTKFRAESKFSTWLYAIATNLVRTHYRWKGRHPEVSLDAHEEGQQSIGEVLPDTASSPHEMMIAEERSEQVRRAIQALPEDLRTPLILAEYENLSQAEIAGILNCTRKTVEMRIYHARQTLRKTLVELMDVSA